MKLFVTLSLPILINAVLYAADPKTKCDFDYSSMTYYCKNIKGVFPEFYDGSYALECEQCEIQTFQRDTFLIDNNLISITLTDVGMELIADNAFEALTKLQFIYLQHNKIKTISTDAFYGLEQVSELNLEYNEVSELNFHFLNGLRAETLVLSHNQLTEIPPDIFEGNLGVMDLDLSHNYIDQLHKNSFNHLHGLEYLHLQHNRLCSLPLGMFRHFGELKELNLAGNNIKKFNYGVFSGLLNLKLLNISNNDLMKFDFSALVPLSKISHLDVSANGLKSLDIKSMDKMAPSLTEIGISDNLWTCSDLVYLVQYFRGRSIEVSEHDRYDVTNVKGIACIDRRFTPYNITFEEFYETVKDLTETANDLC